MEWRDYFLKRVLKRSYDIDINDLKLFREERECYFAIVKGTIDYNLMLTKDLKRISCTCPFTDTGNLCKHMAFLLNYIDNNFQKIDIKSLSKDLLQIDFQFKEDKLKNIVIEEDDLIKFIVDNTNFKKKLVEKIYRTKEDFLKIKGLIIDAENVNDLNSNSQPIEIDEEELINYIYKHININFLEEDIKRVLDCEMDYFTYKGLIRNNENTETKIALNYEKLKGDKEYIINVLKIKGLKIFERANKEIRNDFGFIQQLINDFGYEILLYCNQSMVEKFRRNPQIDNYLKKLTREGFNSEIKSLLGKRGMEYRDNEKQALYIIEKNRYKLNYGQQFNLVSDRLKKDKNFILQVVKINGLLLQYVNEKLKDDEDVVFAAVKDNRLAFCYASERLRNNKELALLALKNDGQPLYHIGNLLKNDRDVVNQALENFGASIENIGLDLRDDKEIVLKAVEKYYYNLKYASERLKDDKDIVMAAIKSNFEALEFASDALRNDEDIAIHMIHHDNELKICYNCHKRYYNEELKNNCCPKCFRPVCNEKLDKNYKYLGKNLAYSEKFINSLKLETFDHISEILKTINGEITDSEFFMKEMIKIDDRLFRYSSLDLLNNVEFAKWAVQNNIENIKYVGYNILNNKEFINANISGGVILEKVKCLQEYYNKVGESIIKRCGELDSFYINSETKRLNKFNIISDKFNIGLNTYRFLLENQYLYEYDILRIDIEKLKKNNKIIAKELETLQNKINNS